MNAKEARKLSELNAKNNNELQGFIEMTNNNIQRAVQKEERKCVLVRKNSLLPSLIAHFENLGYKVKTNVPHYIETYYLFW